MPKGVYLRIPGKPRPWQRHRRIVMCLNCGKQIERPFSDGKRKYCSRECNIAHYRGQNHHAYTRTLSSDRHRMTTLDGKVRAEHRRIAEGALGRTLKRYEVVHHINGDKLDNRPENLLICTLAYHQWLHMEMSLRYARQTFPPAPGDSTLQLPGGIKIGNNSPPIQK